MIYFKKKSLVVVQKIGGETEEGGTKAIDEQFRCSSSHVVVGCRGS